MDIVDYLSYEREDHLCVHCGRYLTLEEREVFYDECEDCAKKEV